MLVEAEEASVPLPGTSFRPERDDPEFETGHYFPESKELNPDLGNLLDIALVESTAAAVPGANAAGTSGSAWETPLCRRIARSTCHSRWGR